MGAQKGKDLLLKVQSGAAFETVAGLRATRIAFNAETVDVTHVGSAGRWRELLATEPGRPLVLLLDDGEVLRDCPAAEVFREVVRGDLPGRGLVLGGNADALCTGLSGWQVEARKARQGVLLSPQGSTDGDLVGVRVPRSALGGAVRPGRGLLHLGDGVLRTVALPAAP